MSQAAAPKTDSEQARNYTYKGGKAPNPRHLAIALQHANQIQAQKDAEALILDRILELVDFPSSDSADPAQPSVSDAVALKSALLPFQPTDYDNLVLERNIEGHCGYPLCPREHRKEDPSAKFRILWGPKGSGENGRGREMKVVPREKLEMWCSDQCAERAMYLRVQLAEEPVWERRAADSQTKKFVLLEEARQMKEAEATKKGVQVKKTTVESNVVSVDRTLSGKMTALSINDETLQASSENVKQLALERGDTGPTFQKQGRVDVHIRENDVKFDESTPAAPVAQPGDKTGGSIEGYVPQNLDDQQRHLHDNDGTSENKDILDNI